MRSNCNENLLTSNGDLQFQLFFFVRISFKLFSFLRNFYSIFLSFAFVNSANRILLFSIILEFFFKIFNVKNRVEVECFLLKLFVNYLYRKYLVSGFCTMMVQLQITFLGFAMVGQSKHKSSILQKCSIDELPLNFAVSPHYCKTLVGGSFLFSAKLFLKFKCQIIVFLDWN